MIKIINENKTDLGWVFEVQVTNNDSETNHEVLLKKDTWQRLKGERSNPKELIVDSFKFLLEREPKEAILGKFDLELIGKYFPEYEKEIKG